MVGRYGEGSIGGQRNEHQATAAIQRPVRLVEHVGCDRENDGDIRTAQESVDALAGNPQVSAAGIYDGSGRLFAGYARAPGLLSDRLDRQAPRGGNLVEATAPVLRGGQRIGAVTMGIVAVASRTACT